MNKRLVGELGEIEAARYLRCHGYDIVSANFRCKFGEIDIIAEDKKYICFVEVKTRSEGMRYAPSDAVNYGKRSRIISAAQIFLAKYDADYEMKRQPRFDIVEVYFENDEPVRLNHIENAFDSSGN